MNDISFAEFNSDALDCIQVATPCRADWNAMKGDDRARFCPTCAKNVYNLSGMTRLEAESLLREKEDLQEGLCARFYKRADGTVITSDCPVGMRVIRRPMKWMATTIVMVLAPLLALGGALAFGGALGGAQISRNARTSSSGNPVATLRAMQPFKTVFDWLKPEPVVMGGLMKVPLSVSPKPLPASPPNKTKLS